MYNCVVQESYVVQDPSTPPSNTLLLSPLTSLYSVITRNREFPHQGGITTALVTDTTLPIMTDYEDMGFLV